MAAVLCGGLVLLCLAGVQLWLPAVTPPQYVVLAALAAVMAGAAVGLAAPRWLDAARPIFLLALLSAVTVLNLSTHVVPNQFVFASLAMGGLLLWQQPGEVIPALVSAFTCAFGLLVVESYLGEEMGMGLVTLGGIVGLLMGWPGGPLALLLFLLLGAAAGLMLIHCGHTSSGSSLPVLPFLAPAALLQWFISHGRWLDPSWEMMLMVAGFAAFILANRRIRSR